MPYFTRENTRIFYREQGTGPLLLILPGNTSSSFCHEEEIGYFCPYYRVVSPDFRGTGQSDRMETWPDNWWDICAADVSALITHLKEERALIIGTGGGAAIGLLTAILYPEQVRAVVADSCVEILSYDRIMAEMEARRTVDMAQKNFWRHAHGKDWEQVVNADSNMLCRFMENSGDLFRGRLKEITCPTLFTASLRDQLLPDAGEQLCRMSRQVPESRVYLVSSGSHPLMWTCPDRFRRMTDVFLCGLRR